MKKLAKMYLTLSCQGLAFEQIIMKKTAAKMWEALKDLYEPNEVDDYLELTQKFTDCNISSKQDDI